MLEGKELEGQIGDVGNYSLDVDAKGKVVISLEAKKDLGYAKFSSMNQAETDIFKIAEEITKKTETKFDDQLVAGLKNLLGIMG